MKLLARLRFPSIVVGHIRPHLARAVVLWAALLGIASPALAVTFSFTNGPGLVTLLGGTPADQGLANNVINGFNAAANRWAGKFVDPITINIGIDYQSLPPNVLGNSSQATIGDSYANVRNALQVDITTAYDVQAVAGLPAGPNLAFYTAQRSPIMKIFDNDGSANNQFLDVPRANAKALGLLAGNDPAQDATVAFSSNFAWDFSGGPTIAAGFNDFIGTATHELGHAMGFRSGVDIVDQFSGSGPNVGVDLNGGDPGLGTLDIFRIHSVLDLYRHSAQSAAISPTTLDLATGGSPFFSLDGVTNLGDFATGQFNGDGRQASHWKNLLISLGLMDPVLPAGTLGILTPLDLLAVDVIGYDLVPEPGTLLFAGISLAGLFGCCVRKRRLAG